MTTTTGKQTLHASHGRNRVRRQPKDVAFDVVLYLICAVLLILILYPLWFIVIASFSDPSAVAGGHVWFVPVGFTLDGYEELLNQPNVWVGYRNTILYTVVGTLVGLAVNIPAAYALARMKFKGQTAFLGFIIVSQMFAPVVLLIGIYKVMQILNLTNSILGLIFINAAFNQAFTIWLLRGTFMSISAEMEQAATIDGCNRVQAMLRILLPVAAPGIVTTLIFIFINAWNEYTVALCLISTDTFKPLTVGINIFNGYNMIEWQYLFAASIFAIIPVVILFMSIEKNLTSGLTAGGVKG